MPLERMGGRDWGTERRLAGGLQRPAEARVLLEAHAPFCAASSSSPPRARRAAALRPPTARHGSQEHTFHRFRERHCSTQTNTRVQHKEGGGRGGGKKKTWK